MQLDDLIKKLQQLRECYGNTEVRQSMSGLGNIPLTNYNFYVVMKYDSDGITATTMISNPHWNEVVDLIKTLNMVKEQSIEEA